MSTTVLSMDDESLTGEIAVSTLLRIASSGNVVTNSIGCYIYTGQPSRKRKRTKVATGVEAYVTAVALIAAGRGEELKAIRKGGRSEGVFYHVSHLCHVPACFNHRHLVVEAVRLNLERKACSLIGKPGGFDPCRSGWMMSAAHQEMPCILPDERDGYNQVPLKRRLTEADLTFR